MGLKVDHLLGDLSDQTSMFYATNREVRMVNGEREISEYATSRHQLENITIPKLQSVE
jgi:hypothetical protein